MRCLRRGISSLSRHPFSAPIRQPLPPSSLLLRPRSACHSSPHQARRQLLTLAIETSCDDTCVAVLEKDTTGAARLHFNEKITSDSRAFGGIHPSVAIISHTEHLAPLVGKALRALPVAEDGSSLENGKVLSIDGQLRLKPDFVSVTRGPGMPTNLAVGVNTAKGLAVSWGVPLMAVNHMQAHALTPRLVRALEWKKGDQDQVRDPDPESPQFPFLSLLVSGGHTILVHSRSINDHGILASAPNIAVGDMVDKCARSILPREVFENSSTAMYGSMLEEFAFPGSKENASYDYEYTPPANRGEEIAPLDLGFGWTLTPPLYSRGTGDAAAAIFDFSGANGQVQGIMTARPDMVIEERRALAKGAMRVAFEHLANRVYLALQGQERKLAHLGDALDTTAQAETHTIKTLVLSGGVASNKYLRHIMQATLNARGFSHVELVAPPVPLCTDNAAMIAWTAMEMYEQGWRSDLGVPCIRRWPLDPAAEGGGILGVPGWHRVSVAA